MLVQAGVFAANYLVVKHLLVSPYLELKKARENETEGAKKEADLLVLEASKIEDEIASRMKVAFESAKDIRSRAQKKAKQDYEKIVGEAKKRSDEHLMQVTSEIDLALKQERQKMAKESSLLSSFLSSLLVPKEKA